MHAFQIRLVSELSKYKLLIVKQRHKKGRHLNLSQKKKKELSNGEIARERVGTWKGKDMTFDH